MEVLGIKEAYEATAPRLNGMPLQRWIELTSGFECYPMHVKGLLCGAVLVNGNELHACILPWAHGRWFGRKAARVLNGVIDRHGSAITRVTTEDGKRFVEALGFKQEGEIYRSTKKWVLNQSLAR